MEYNFKNTGSLLKPNKFKKSDIYILTIKYIINIKIPIIIFL